MPDETQRRGFGDDETCRVCGGDRRIQNSFGVIATCPSCHGSGRRTETTGLRDVTKTKPSHYQPAATKTAGAAPRPTWPTTHEGGKLATEVQASTTCTTDVKAKLVREIIDYEQSHGQCTQTFIKKVRKQLRPPT